MKGFVKIIVIIAALSASVVAVLSYEKKKVEPPKVIKEADVYHEYLERYLAEDYDWTDSAFDSMVVYIITFREEGRLEGRDADIFLDSVVAEYVPRYVERCSDVLEKKWGDKDIQVMSMRVNALEGLTYSDGTSVATHGRAASLSKIKGVIGEYYAALRLCRNTSFGGKEDARKKVREANGYLKNKYLKNCEALCYELKTVKNKIASSHRWYVDKKIRDLSGYRSYATREDYDKSVVSKVDNAIKDYEDNISIYGVSKSSVEEMREVKNIYLGAAYHYFNTERGR